MTAVRRLEAADETPSKESAPDQGRKRDTLLFLKGLVVGFGLAAAASVFVNLFQEQRESRREAMKPSTRFRTQDESGGVLGDLSHVVDESTSAFRDAVRALDKTFESGRRAVDSVQDVIDKIRE